MASKINPWCLLYPPAKLKGTGFVFSFTWWSSFSSDICDRGVLEMDPLDIYGLDSFIRHH